MEVLMKGDQILIVEGGSEDLTYQDALFLQKQFPLTVKVLNQDRFGKFDAVIKGINHAIHNTVMVWDADATVNFHQNIEIYQVSNIPEALVTGDRLRGKRDKGAMRIANFFGNWAFALVWAPYLKSKPIDLLCGSKKFPKKLVEKSPEWLKQLDPYGDFTMFEMARKMELPIISIPVHYHSRSHGKTNIRRWQGGLNLLRISLLIFYRSRFKAKW
jgi:glycosyltransferase involved in cell wall biosynthesis